MWPWPAESLLGSPPFSQAPSREKLLPRRKAIMSFSCPEDSSSEVRLPVQVPNSYFQNWGQPVLETQGKAHRPPDSVWTLTMHF